jgi:hypothetical protein
MNREWTQKRKEYRELTGDMIKGNMDSIPSYSQKEKLKRIRLSSEKRDVKLSEVQARYQQNRKTNVVKTYVKAFENELISSAVRLFDKRMNLFRGEKL